MERNSSSSKVEAASAESRLEAESRPTVDAVEKKVVALAEQMERLIGTVQARAEGWLDRNALHEQITRIRESAGDVLKELAPDKARPRSEKRGKTPTPPRGSRAASARLDPAHAPGKKHRPPMPSAHGVKHSDQRLAKLRVAKLIRRSGPKG
jgi:hypothetical protein